MNSARHTRICIMGGSSIYLIYPVKIKGEGVYTRRRRDNHQQFSEILTANSPQRSAELLTASPPIRGESKDTDRAKNHSQD